MNDAFLYKAQPRVRPSFARELFSKLQRQENPWERFKGYVATRRRFANAVLGLILLAACTQLILNSTFRHAADVGGVAIYESHDFLLIDASALVEAGLNPGDHPRSDEPDFISVSEAIASLDYRFNLPDWSPEGFELVDPIRENRSNWDFAFTPSWYSAEYDTVLAMAAHQANGSSLETEHVYPGAWEVLEIDGVEVLIVRGAFELPFDSEEEAQAYLDAGGGPVEQRWNEEGGVAVHWVQNGVHYHLWTLTSPFPWSRDADTYIVPVDDLLRMAESLIENN